MTITLRIYQQADDAWQAELVRVYGERAGDARYDARGTASAVLAALKEARATAQYEYHRIEDSRRRVLSATCQHGRGSGWCPVVGWH